MTDKLLPVTPDPQFRPAESVSELLGFLRGMSPQSAHSWMYRVRQDYLMVLGAYVEVAPNRVLAFHGPADAILDALPSEGLTSETVRDAQHADMNEDKAEADWHANPQDVTARRAWLRGLYTQRSHTSRVIQDLTTEMAK